MPIKLVPLTTQIELTRGRPDDAATTYVGPVADVCPQWPRSPRLPLTDLPTRQEYVVSVDPRGDGDASRAGVVSAWSTTWQDRLQICGFREVSSTPRQLARDFFDDHGLGVVFLVEAAASGPQLCDELSSAGARVVMCGPRGSKAQRLHRCHFAPVGCVSIAEEGDGVEGVGDLALILSTPASEALRRHGDGMDALSQLVSWRFRLEAEVAVEATEPGEAFEVHCDGAGPLGFVAKIRGRWRVATGKQLASRLFSTRDMAANGPAALRKMP